MRMMKGTGTAEDGECGDLCGDGDESFLPKQLRVRRDNGVNQRRSDVNEKCDGR